jgi:hypothetical protein
VESPTVPSRASPKQSGGGIGGFRGKKNIITSAMVDLFIHTRKPQSAGYACDRKQSFLTPQNRGAFEKDSGSFNLFH